MGQFQELLLLSLLFAFKPSCHCLHFSCSLFNKFLQNIFLLDKFLLTFLRRFSISVIPLLQFFDPQSKVPVVSLHLLHQVSQSSVLSFDLHALVFRSDRVLLCKGYLPFKTFAFVFELVVHLLADSLRFQNLFVTLHLSLNFADLLL